jgi:Xaa-Pro aminopeptidase
VQLTSIQRALRDERLDGWLFYDHHHRDPIAYRVLGIQPKMCTRRWYYLIPAEGEPQKLVHRIERGTLNNLPGKLAEYSAWQAQREGLRRMLAGKKKLAMQYSALNDIPYVGLVDAGTVELVRSFGIEVVSSADLVQLFEARWSPAQLKMHLEAGRSVHAIIRAAFGFIRDAARAGKTIGEYDVQQEIVKMYESHGLVADEAPLVAVNEHASDPHYSPTRESSRPIRKDDFVLLDVWAKRREPGAVYFDVTWTGFVAEQVPEKYTEIFEIVREARDAAIDLVRRAMREGRPLRGYQVDDAARGVIAQRGYGDFFVHRTGHSIGEDIHGSGANMDNYETRDDRRVLPSTCFSVEPGIYLPEFGVRSEVNVFVEERDARVTGEIQQAVVPVLAVS